MNESAEAQMEMPRYKCNKQVWALKIAKIELHGGISGDGATITPAEPRYAPFDVPGSYVLKHNPQSGGYYVVYDDGYKSFSPAKAFEEGYSRI
jgi:hypothetical protein